MSNALKGSRKAMVNVSLYKINATFNFVHVTKNYTHSISLYEVLGSSESTQVKSQDDCNTSPRIPRGSRANLRVPTRVYGVGTC